jgi:DUF1365 family protein
VVESLVAATSLVKTVVYHKRYTPAIHHFSHKIFYIALNINAFKTPPVSRFFSINSWNLFSIFLKDYGFQTITDAKTYVMETLSSFKIDTNSVTNIVLLTLPRVLGYVFNPVSFWLCLNQDEELIAVYVEVNNTFGERHGYVCCGDLNQPISKNQIITRNKVFHVSPFCQVEGYYEFRFDMSSQKINIDINYLKKNDPIITTSIRGKRTPFLDKNLLKYFFIYPFQTLKVIFLIHYHAFLLWFKKVAYVKKPKKPEIDIT